MNKKGQVHSMCAVVCKLVRAGGYLTLGNRWSPKMCLVPLVSIS